MGAKPWTDAEIADARMDVEADAFNHEREREWTMRWLATVDALQARLAAAEDECRAREEVQARLIRERNAAEAELDALRAALDAAPEPAQEPVDALCLFCRTELDLDEMDDGSDLPPLAPGVCSECFQRWHDEPVWRKRLKEATYPPAPDAALLERVAPMVAALLRDAESAIEAHRGPGQHVGTPKATVDALRLANVCRAIAAAKGGAA